MRLCCSRAAPSQYRRAETAMRQSCHERPQAPHLCCSVVTVPAMTSVRRALRPVKRVAWRLELERDAARARRRAVDLALFHDFAPPPAGGGHQTLRALAGELERRGVRVGINTLSPSTR